MYTYRWSCDRRGPFLRYVHVTVTYGFSRESEQRRLLASGFMRGPKRAMNFIRNTIQQDMDTRKVWRVSEGGQSPVANNYSIRPDLDGLISPKMRREML